MSEYQAVKIESHPNRTAKLDGFFPNDFATLAVVVNVLRINAQLYFMAGKGLSRQEYGNVNGGGERADGW
jgi:hypothetical protein